MCHDDVVKSMKLIKTIKARDSKEHQVYETTAEVRNILLKEERVYIDYDRCRVKDFLDVTRFYRCQLYGHIGRNCKKRTQYAPIVLGIMSLRIATREINLRFAELVRDSTRKLVIVSTLEIALLIYALPR